MTKKSIKPVAAGYGSLLDVIGEIIINARRQVVQVIDTTQVSAYWRIGQSIVEYEQKGRSRAEYGDALIDRLSEDMRQRFGKGFSTTNLKMMRLFYQVFPIRQTVSDESVPGSKASALKMIGQTSSDQFRPLLGWSHYCELLKEDGDLARAFYEKESVENRWSVRELKRQMNASLFERLSLSKDKKKVLQLAKQGHIIEKPEDAIKDPYILEFLNLREDAAYSETQLEQALIDKLQYFLLELGKGFSFVARQRRITVANRHYRVDLVFYNRLLKCFVLVDLKSGELDHADAGQMNLYLNYFKEHEKGPDENDPIGLILCTKKSEVFAKYVLGGMNNKIFASKYKLALPSEKQLHNQLILHNK